MSEEHQENCSAGFPFSVSEIWGGITDSNAAWRPALMRLSQRLSQVTFSVISPVEIRLEFHVSGDVWQPDWEGVRTGSFDKNARILMIQATLPESPPSASFDFLRERLTQAIELLEPWAKRRKLSIDVQPYLDVLNEL